MRGRDDALAAASDAIYDVAVIGGGITGASLYDRLCRGGYKVLLVDKGDFGSGTSQASAMMVWGGLLYLKNFDLAAVYGFSRSRDRMIRHMGDWVSPRTFRFLPAPGGVLSKAPALAALYLYWLMAGFQRRRPEVEARYREQVLLARPDEALLFEEAMLRDSDTRFVLSWITRHRSEHTTPLNYVELVDGAYHPQDKLWRLDLRDVLGAREVQVRARVVANCAGVWTDRLNALFGIRSPYKHAFSKGVFLAFERASGHEGPLIFEMGEHDDVINSIPWGPVELWGPTEETVSDIDQSFKVTPEDVTFLLDHRNRRMKDRRGTDAIVSLRCGIRPLAVAASYDGDDYSLDLSRRVRIAVEPVRPWVSVYGGKITGCSEAAARVVSRLRGYLPEPARPAAIAGAAVEDVETAIFPGLEDPVPTVAWCRDNELCCNLEDYLRRRTNIAQWLPRCGLGRDDRHLEQVRALSLELANGDEARAEVELERYRGSVAEGFDDVLAGVQLM